MSATTRWMTPVTAGIFALGVSAALAQAPAPAPAAPAAPAPAAPPAAAAPAPAAPPAAAAPAAAPAGKLTGLAAWTALVGNSVSGKVDGEDYTDYYMDNGTVKTLHGSKLSSGKWSFDGGKACFLYPKEDPDCYTVEVDGDVANFTDKSGTGTRFKVEKGNPKKL